MNSTSRIVEERLNGRAQRSRVSPTHLHDFVITKDDDESDNEANDDIKIFAYFSIVIRSHLMMQQ